MSEIYGWSEGPEAVHALQSSFRHVSLHIWRDVCYLYCCNRLSSPVANALSFAQAGQLDNNLKTSSIL